MSIDNCDLRLWRPAAPAARPGSSARSPLPDHDPVDAAGIVDLDVHADGTETTATER